MEKRQVHSKKAGTGKKAVKDSPEKKKRVKTLVTGTTEILDFDLDAELESREDVPRKKTAAKKTASAAAGRESVKKAAPETERKAAVKKTASASESRAPKKSKPDDRMYRETASKAGHQHTEGTGADSQPEKKAYGEHMPAKPVSVSEEALELLDMAELLEQDKEREAFRKERKADSEGRKPAQEGHRTGPESRKAAQEGRRTGPESRRPVREDRRADKESRKAAAARPSAKSTKAAPKPVQKAKKKTGFFTDFNAMDVIVALTGVLVLFVAVVTFGVYASANSVNKQVEAMARVGEKMETIGIAGEGIFVAVADARLAGMEEEEESVSQEGEEGSYDEKELTSDISVGLKLTSVQKDLKIKFTNKKSGKLIGNQPFAVEVKGPETKKLTDDDEDGIIYIKSITPGEYTVTITGPETIDDNPVAGIKGLVTVKDKIDYKKIDVSDEVKKESEINAAKEDTAVHDKVESVLQDTVEWVESTKTPLGGDGGSDTYEKVDKKDIPDPTAKAVLDMIWTADTQNGAYLSSDIVKLEQNAAYFAQNCVKTLEKGVYFTEASTEEGQPVPYTEGEDGSNDPAEGEGGDGDNSGSGENTGDGEDTTPPESEPPKEGRVDSVSISGGGTYTVGDTVTLTAEVKTSGDLSLSDSDYQWSGDKSGSGKTLSFTADAAGKLNVQLTVKGQSASIEITVNEKQKPAEVESVSVSVDASRAEAGKSVTATASVKMTDGSSYSGSIEWRTEGDGGSVSGSGSTATVTGSKAGKVKVFAKADGKEVSAEIEFYSPDKKVSSLEIPGSTSVYIGKEVQLSLKVSPEDAKDKSVEWKVTKGSDIASVDGNGKVRGLKAGTAEIQAIAKDGSGVKSNVCSIKVEKEAFAVTMEDPGSVAVGEKKELKYSANRELKDGYPKWRVSDTKLATIDEKTGKVKGIAVGTVQVTVRVKDKNDNVAEATKDLKIVVTDEGDLRLEPSKITLKPKEYKTIRVAGSVDGSQDVKWSSSNEEIAVISEQGKGYCIIETKKTGTAVITATSTKDKNKSATCEVTVDDGSEPLKDKDGNQLYYKKDGQYIAAKTGDYTKYDTFYRKKASTQYFYTGWQTIDGKRYYFDKNGKPVTGDQVIQGMRYTFNSDGSLQVNGLMGIDVSKHNGNIDWNAVKNAGVNYVIIRCGYRGSATGVLVEDQKFRANIQGATAAGLKVGIYVFSQAVNEPEAVEEASMALDLIRKYKITYPVFIDVESANGRADGIDAGTRTRVIQAFCNTIMDSGYRAGVYANKNWLSEKIHVSALGNYKIWLAQYAATPTYGGRYDMWQYSSTGRIPGISGNVDLNISYLNY